jgi:hypothetical protein
MRHAVPFVSKFTFEVLVDQDVSWKTTMTTKVGPSTVEIRGLDASAIAVGNLAVHSERDQHLAQLTDQFALPYLN